MASFKLFYNDFKHFDFKDIMKEYSGEKGYTMLKGTPIFLNIEGTYILESELVHSLPPALRMLYSRGKLTNFSWHRTGHDKRIKRCHQQNQKKSSRLP